MRAVAVSVLLVGSVVVASSGGPAGAAPSNGYELWVWGTNDDGGLGVDVAGNNPIGVRDVPARIGTDADPGWSYVAAGGQKRFAAIRADGTLWEWGAIGPGVATSPRQVGDDAGWLTVDIGNCDCMAALRSEPNGGRSLWTWGGNHAGVLGTGDQTDHASPHRVGPETDWLDVEVGSEFMVALRAADGGGRELWSWGTGLNGQLGLGPSVTQTLVPTQIGTDSNWVSISANTTVAAATQADGDAYEWGSGGGRNTLGITPEVDVFEPLEIPSPKAEEEGEADIGWLHVEAGAVNGSMLGLLTDGSAWSWGGNNVYGQLGSPDFGASACAATIAFPCHVYPIDQPAKTWRSVHVSNAGATAHAIDENGSLWGWGLTDVGQVGAGQSGFFACCQATPVEVAADPTRPWAMTAGGTLVSIGLRGQPPAVTVSVADGTGVEGDGPDTTGTTFTASLAQATAVDVTFTVTPQSGSATADVDFSSVSQTVTILAGDIVKDFTVDILPDDLAEPTEAFTVALSNPTGGGVLTAATAAGTITDDDAAPVIDSTSGPTTSTPEGTAVQLVAAATDLDTPAQSLTYTWSPAATPGLVQPPPGQATATYTPPNQGIAEFTVTACDPASNCSAPSPPVAVQATNVAPSFGPTPADLTGVAGAPVGAQVLVTDPGTDDTFTGTFDWGDGTTPSTVATVNGHTLTADHTYAAAGSYTGQVCARDTDMAPAEPDACQPFTATITDEVRNLSLTGGTVTEGNTTTSPARLLTFTVALDSASTADISVQFATTAGGTATPGVDFVALNRSVTIPAGQLSASVDVTVVGDDQVEPAETVGATISTVTGPATITVATATGSIIDDDSPCTVVPTPGQVTVRGTAGNDVICGTAANETILGLGGSDVILGGGGADTIDGGAGNDTIDGGAGNDTIDGGTGADTIDGGAGADTIEHRSATGPVVVDLAPGTGTDTATTAGVTDLLTGIENVEGTRFADVLRGDAGPNRIVGLGGNDVIAPGGGTGDAIDGGGGIDQLDLSRSPDETTVDLDAGTMSRWSTGTVTSIENVRGSEQADAITGSGTANTLLGLGGNDIIHGGAGNDTVGGGIGNDHLFGGIGGDDITGGDGDDLIWGDEGADELFGDDGADILRGGTGADELFGMAGDDFLFGDDGGDTLGGGTGTDHLFGGIGGDDITGGDGDDLISGDEGADDLFGDDGADILRGGTGADDLFGMAGDDFLFGDDGGDNLNGGTGTNTLNGGANRDSCTFGSVYISCE